MEIQQKVKDAKREILSTEASVDEGEGALKDVAVAPEGTEHHTVAARVANVDLAVPTCHKKHKALNQKQPQQRLLPRLLLLQHLGPHF
jgi:hypothetical protein